MPIRLRHTTRHPQLPGNREPLGLWLSHVKTELFVGHPAIVAAKRRRFAKRYIILSLSLIRKSEVGWYTGTSKLQPLYICLVGM